MNAVVLLAHQGGWDEMLLVAGPIALVVILIRLARKRADAMQSAREHSASATTTDAVRSSDRATGVEGQDGAAVT